MSRSISIKFDEYCIIIKFTDYKAYNLSESHFEQITLKLSITILIDVI